VFAGVWLGRRDVADDKAPARISQSLSLGVLIEQQVMEDQHQVGLVRPIQPQGGERRQRRELPGWP
jgi:hypothetical protein